MPSVPVVLSIAGSDNSAGAGIQADLKTLSALGTYGLTAVTCVVAEVPGQVSGIQAVSAQLVGEQIRLSMASFPVGAIKTGMLYSAEILREVARVLELEKGRSGRIPPLVVDPVMVATSGALLMETSALEGYRTQLFQMATVITPNLDEVAVLTGKKVNSRQEMLEAGKRLSGEYGTAVLVKGGHLRERIAADVLVTTGGGESWFEAIYVDGVSTHGTGCTYSAAIAAGLAKGLSLGDAVTEAKQYLTRAIQAFLRWDGQSGSVDALAHFV